MSFCCVVLHPRCSIRILLGYRGFALPVPEKAWSVVSLDFIEGLPKSQSYNAILMVVDKFTKYGHFIPLAHPFTALSVAKLYFAHIYKLHGLPDAIISD